MREPPPVCGSTNMYIYIARMYIFMYAIIIYIVIHLLLSGEYVRTRVGGEGKEGAGVAPQSHRVSAFRGGENSGSESESLRKRKREVYNGKSVRGDPTRCRREKERKKERERMHERARERNPIFLHFIHNDVS